jgi:hypothetical protein
MGTSPRTAAADLIRSIDHAFAEQNSKSVDAARDAEEARRNARIASELARRYRIGSSPRAGDVFTFHTGADGNFFSDASLEVNGSDYYASHGHANGRQKPSPDSESDTSPGKQKNGTFTSPSDRSVKSHAEDALSISLELERVKRSLHSEEMAHDETRSALAQARAKNAQLETQLDRMDNIMETQREGSGRTIDAMEHELDRAGIRVELAEEDAQLALDLAKSNAESRVQLEEWLGKALEELEVLREHVHTMEATKPKHAVHFADSPTFFAESPPARSHADFSADQPARSMISAGRQILQRSLGAGSDDDSMPFVSVSPSQSAERRRRLVDRLKTSEEQKVYFLDSAGSTKDQSGQASVSARKTLDACRNAARILKQSGERLNLSGRWWKETLDGEFDGAHLETLTRHYCTSVEVREFLVVAR